MAQLRGWRTRTANQITRLPVSGRYVTNDPRFTRPLSLEDAHANISQRKFPYEATERIPSGRFSRCAERLDRSAFRPKRRVLAVSIDARDILARIELDRPMSRDGSDLSERREETRGCALDRTKRRVKLSYRWRLVRFVPRISRVPGSRIDKSRYSLYEKSERRGAARPTLPLSMEFSPCRDTTPTFEADADVRRAPIDFYHSIRARPAYPSTRAWVTNEAKENGFPNSACGHAYPLTERYDCLCLHNNRPTNDILPGQRLNRA